MERMSGNDVCVYIYIGCGSFSIFLDVNVFPGDEVNVRMMFLHVNVFLFLLEMSTFLEQIWRTLKIVGSWSFQDFNWHALH